MQLLYRGEGKPVFGGKEAVVVVEDGIVGHGLVLFGAQDDADGRFGCATSADFANAFAKC